MDEDNNGRKKDKESGIADVIKKVVGIGVGGIYDRGRRKKYSWRFTPA